MARMQHLITLPCTPLKHRIKCNSRYDEQRLHMSIVAHAAIPRLCTVVQRLALNAIFRFISKGNTWSNPVICTCIRKQSGSGCRTGCNFRGKMAGNVVQKHTRVQIILGLNSIRVGPWGCRTIEEARGSTRAADRAPLEMFFYSVALYPLRPHCDSCL